MSLTLEKIFEAKNRIAPYTTRTPLIRLEKLDEYLGCQVYLKAECMQITGAFKLRGAVNKIRMLTPEQLSCGIVAASSGNHGKAVAYTAKKLGAKATIVMPYTAPAIKVNAIKELGAEVVQCETSERFDVAERICGERNATMVPPYNDGYYGRTGNRGNRDSGTVSGDRYDHRSGQRWRTHRRCLNGGKGYG